jgi:hypothetical protein
VSKHGETAILNSLVDSVFDDVGARVGRDHRVQGLTHREWSDLVLAVLSAICDPDGRGEPFVFTGSPGCPHCGSRTVTDFVETECDLGVAGGPISHRRYDAAEHAARQALISSALDRLLDGA